MIFKLKPINTYTDLIPKRALTHRRKHSNSLTFPNFSSWSLDMLKKYAVCLVTASVLSGCMTYDPYTGEEEVSKSTSGAVIGAVAGAIIGVATSSKSDRAKGALIGAAAGGAIGGGAGYYMDKQEAALRHQLKGSGINVVRNGNEITLVMPGNITFETGKSNIQDDFESTINSLALVLEEFDKTAIQIMGHTDSTGSLGFNQTLSEQRAGSVKLALQARKIASGRIHASGQGPRVPIATNNTAEGRQANRRVELKLLPLNVE
ncbi:MAG: outer membrane protein OmpA-like peptidoglycan-associated protein [Oleiphilaceae bacterium]|jgi:outer membrane protein OmpA-like peptidoglycan-associated protein